STLIVLPDGEEILEATIGDKEFWPVNVNHHIATIKPAKAGSSTDLNLITSSGNIYSFLLAEVSETPGGVPDFKVFIKPSEASMTAAVNAHPKFYSADTVEDYRRQVDIAKEETRQAKQACEAAVDSGISKFISNVRFPYRYEAGRKPFFVRA